MFSGQCGGAGKPVLWLPFGADSLTHFCEKLVSVRMVEPGGVRRLRAASVKKHRCLLRVPSRRVSSGVRQGGGVVQADPS